MVARSYMSAMRNFFTPQEKFVVCWKCSCRNCKGNLKVRAILEYFCCMIRNTAKAWSYHRSRSHSDMLRVWFSCDPFEPNECGAKWLLHLRFAPITSEVLQQFSQ
jgi:hypothetical protein